MSDDTADWTQINIASPIPLDVAGTLMSLIGAAWPSAVVSTEGQRDTWGAHQFALSMRVNPADRPRRVTQKQAADLVAEEASEVDMLGFDDGWLTTATPEELGLELGAIAHAMFTGTEGAINYVEWQVHTKDGERYVLSVAKSKDQTPDALRKKAEARVEELKAALEAVSA